jgi:hypothetical protein
MLTGDQIYADDVPEPLINSIINLAEALMGFDERLPDVAPRMSNWQCSQLRCGMRANRLQTWYAPRFSSGKDAGRNQLMGFGEFAAAYLLAWGEVCWPERLPDRNLCDSADEVTKLSPPYAEQLSRVEQYRQQLKPIRRALANIATYQIMDDHEVTDDWNISGQWLKAVQGDYCARRVISNAMAAYWCFQAQGNVPDDFAIDDSFQEYIDALRKGSDHTATTGAESRDWTFVTPTSPPVLVLNTRTRRDFGHKKTEPPALMSKDALQAAQEMYRSVTRGRAKGQWPLVVVSPVPVLGPGSLDAGQGSLSELLRVTAPWVPSLGYFVDPEAWVLNLDGLANLMWTLRSLAGETCVILSGDVHYGCVLNGVYASATVPPMRIVQFTSSGSRNNSPKPLLALMFGITTVSLPKKRGADGWPPATIMYGFSGAPVRWAPFLPLKFMSEAPTVRFERNIGILELDTTGEIVCRFLIYDDRGTPREVDVEIPKESPKEPPQMLLYP